MADILKNISNIANVKYDYEAIVGITTTNTTESNIANVTVYNPSLYIKKLSANETIEKNGVIKFSMLAVNDGDTTLTSVTFREQLDSNLTIIQESIKVISIDRSTSPSTETLLNNGTDYTVNLPDIIVNVPLFPKKEILLTLSAKVTGSVNLDDTVTNTIKTGFTYSNPDDGTELIVDPEQGKKDSVLVTIKQANLSVLKEIQSVSLNQASGIAITAAKNGDLIAYVIEIGNDGNLTALNVKGIDLLPEELSVSFPSGISVTPPSLSFTCALDDNNLFKFSGLEIPMAISTTPIVIPSSVQIQIIGQLKI